MAIIFWLSLIGIFYSYLIYPGLLLLLPRRGAVRHDSTDSELPPVSLIITAHNEAARIVEKLDNALETAYPLDCFEILVASDASTDGTDAIVERYAARGVRLVRAPERKGKEFAQMLAVRAATHPILVFSDAGTRIPADAIRTMVRNFADPRVGAVSSEDRFVSADGRVVGEGLYVRYEMWLRRLEASVRSLVGLSGSFFAVRREICEHWDVTVPSDFFCALNSVRLGYVAVSDPHVIGEYRDIKDRRGEYRRKVRTIIRGMAAVAARVDVLNPLRFGVFAFEVWSHKIMRWAVPWFLLACLLANCALAGRGGIYAAALSAQTIAYALALIGVLSGAAHASAAVRVPFYFLQANLAAAHALLAFASGTRMTTWTPSSR
jgi:glycosyltransferase involved in cell wall biosynthesis